MDILVVMLIILIFIILILIIFNVIKIKQLENRHKKNISDTALRFSTLNSKISVVMSQNNEINIKNIKILLEKFEKITDLQLSTDSELNAEIATLKNSLQLLMDAQSNPPNAT
jgi:glucan phosphoethanolaminetransferase (alkaline phosphatase superfamily)